MSRHRDLLALAGWIGIAAHVSGEPAGIGLFSTRTDVGAVTRSGAAAYDSTTESYRLSGAGANMWGTNDAFCYLWTRVSGDLELAAIIRWVGTNGNPHRKACLVVRQTLEADSPYADVAVHGNGLTSLQYRESRGGPTREIQSQISAPARVRLEKHGDYVFMALAAEGDEVRPAGGSFRIRFEEPFYAGLAVCAHDASVVESAVFSRVEIKPLAHSTGAPTTVESTLEIISIGSKDRRVVYHTRDHMEAPNWSRDGQWLLFNRQGRLWRLPIPGGEPQALDTGFAVHCNNDHGFSPDGKMLAISDSSRGGKSGIYLLPVTGGTPRPVTSLVPSYWHGWSPDGRTLVYCGERNGEFDVFTIPVEGGQEKRLTSAAGVDDGPDFSPDGRFIYFNSERTGLMQIWRMKPDGSDQEQLTTDDCNNWFAHPSPDGKWLAFLTYSKEVKGHPENKDVMLRLMPASGGEIQTLAKLYGGQGTLNVPSWAPDSQRLAFVSYELNSP